MIEGLADGTMGFYAKVRIVRPSTARPASLWAMPARRHAGAAQRRAARARRGHRYQWVSPSYWCGTVETRSDRCA